jgi:hypothetical protein
MAALSDFCPAQAEHDFRRQKSVGRASPRGGGSANLGVLALLDGAEFRDVVTLHGE